MVQDGMRGMPGAVAVDAAEARPGAAVRDALDGGRGGAAGAGECAVARTVIVFDIGVRLVSVANLREHWATRAGRNKRHRAAAHRATAYELASLRSWARMPDTSRPMTITITRIAPRKLDSDNLASSAKAVRDGIAEALGIDDGSELVAWLYAQTKRFPREYGCQVRIEQRVAE